MNIRIATDHDREDIKRIYSSAFPKGEREIVTKLAVELLSEKTIPKTISLIAEVDDVVVGHIAFSPVRIDDSDHCRAYILAPLAVQADCQRRRIGSMLIEYGLRQLSVAEINIVFVYGDPKYYGRFGFDAETARNYIAPCELQYPFGWQAVVLKECSGRGAPSTITCVRSLCDPELW
ncbi:MAG: N-acetyltransferase [Thiohalocapsa sp.]|uniref:GNAT family N-acetyltransferase n=1 Tax=Thiohalocapsa sp. TaxID=2497641 RepID=UPI0025E3CAE1|nr:N-acetyltransferase [Thiohalocapsa sp.]MCG6941927.1 N-acetyltransferase [Thiohalocapsa sp.]